MTLLSVVILLLATSLTLSAATTLYVNAPDWKAAVPGYTLATLPDPAAGNYTYFGSGNVSTTYDQVQYGVTSMFAPDAQLFLIGSYYTSGGSAISGQNPTSGFSHIQITFPFAVTAAALNYGGFNGTDSDTDTYFLLSNGSQVYVGTNWGAYATPNFAGVTDSTPFNSLTVVVMAANETVAVRDVMYSEAAVPEPATFGLAALALGAFFGVRRLRA